MAKFLQETIRESGIKSPDKIKESEDFKEFFRKVCPVPGAHAAVLTACRSDPLAKPPLPTRS